MQGSKVPKLLTTDYCLLSTPKGFTLVEILVAISILSIGILALSQMTVMGFRVNTVVNQRMYNRVAMSQVFENLNNLPNNDPLFYDDGDSLDLDDVDSTTADHYQIVEDNVAHWRCLAIWNVANNTPEPAFKTIRIHMISGLNNKNFISSDLIKRM